MFGRWIGCRVMNGFVALREVIVIGIKETNQPFEEQGIHNQIGSIGGSTPQNPQAKCAPKAELHVQI